MFFCKTMIYIIALVICVMWSLRAKLYIIRKNNYDM